MKRVIRFLLCLIAIMPIFVHAFTYKNYSNSLINDVNNYVNKYTDKNKYLMFNQPYVYDSSGHNVKQGNFKTGGLLSSYEYEVSKGRVSSYLAIGREYWTLTEVPSSSNQYYVDYTLLNKNRDNYSGIRVTQFVKPEVNADGNGTYSNPWVFKNQYAVEIRVNNSAYGSVKKVGSSTEYSQISDMVNPRTEYTFQIVEKRGRMYTGSDCNLTKTLDSYKTRAITKDITCVLDFDVRKIRIDYKCTDGSGTIPSQTVRYGDRVTIADYSCIRTGFAQEGWKTTSGHSWNKGEITFDVDNGERGIVNNVLELHAKWKANELAFNNQTLNPGNYGSSHTTNAFEGASNGTGNYTYSIKSGGPTGASINSANRTITFNNTTPAATYNVVITAKDNVSGAQKDATMTIVINKSTLACPSSPAAKTYTGSSQASGITCPSGSSAGNNTSATNAGTYSQTCTADGNHEFSGACSVTWVINKKSLTCPSSPADKTYTGSSQTSGITCPSGSNAGNNTSATNAGTYTQSCTANDNHQFSSACNVTWKINKKTLTCPSSPAAKTYTGSSQASGITCPSGSSAGNNTSATNAGAYSQTCTANDNHQFASACSVSWIINKAPATLSCSNKTYSGSAQTACTYSGCSSTTGTSGTNAGSYTATCTADSNHSAVSNVTWTMYKKTLTCPSSPSAKSYTGSSQNSGISCPTGSAAGGDTSKTNAGTYYHTCTPNDNHQFSGTCSVKWVINKVAATLSCSNKTYSGSAQTACSYSGCSSTTGTSGTNAGSYTATCTADSNHSAVSNVTWTMYKKTLTCPSSPSAKSYTGSSQNSGISCPTGSTAGGDTSKTNAGTYYQSCTANTNYQFSGTCSVKWVINKVAAKLSCNNKTYNGSAQTACSSSGCSSTTYTSATNAGSYTATCTPDGNHTAPSNVTWTMNKAKATAPTLTGFTVAYDGSSHCATVTGGSSGTQYYSWCDVNAYDCSVTSNWTNWSSESWNLCSTNVGKWQIVAKVGGSTNYTESDNSNIVTTEIYPATATKYICRYNSEHGWCGNLSAEYCYLSRTCAYSSAYSSCDAAVLGYNNSVVIYTTPVNGRYLIQSVGYDALVDISVFNYITGYQNRYWIGQYCVGNYNSNCASTCPN